MAAGRLRLGMRQTRPVASATRAIPKTRLTSGDTILTWTAQGTAAVH